MKALLAGFLIAKLVAFLWPFRMTVFGVVVCAITLGFIAHAVGADYL